MLFICLIGRTELMSNDDNNDEKFVHSCISNIQTYFLFLNER